MTRRTLLAACAPVPIEDLTVDQIAGPYLEADVYKRHLAQLGAAAPLVLTIDEHHSAIDVTTRASRCEAAAIVAPARSAIEASLRAYAIGIDQIGPRDGGYEPFVRSVFRRLFEAGALVVRDVAVLYDIRSETYPTDAWVRGSCPWCLDSASGGACETCGMPNASADLLALDPEWYALRSRRRLVLELEPMRRDLERSLAQLAVRAPVARLIGEVLARPLAPVILSSEGGRGIALDFLGLPEQTLHSSAETFAAERYVLENVAGPIVDADGSVRFAPFGEAYLHAFVHGGLTLAAKRCGLGWPEPLGLLTTQLRASRGVRSLIWARELTDAFCPDAVRMYLASIGPDLSESHFVRSVMANGIAELAASIDRLVQRWNEGRHAPDARRPSDAPRDVIACMTRELPLADFSSADRARRAFNCLDHLASKAARPRSGVTRYIPSVLAVALEPFCPAYASAVRSRFPEAATRWHALTPCALNGDLPAFETKLSGDDLDASATLARTPLPAA